jgi:hypothetical protein
VVSGCGIDEGQHPSRAESDESGSPEWALVMRVASSARFKRSPRLREVLNFATRHQIVTGKNPPSGSATRNASGCAPKAVRNWPWTESVGCRRSGGRPTLYRSRRKGSTGRVDAIQQYGRAPASTRAARLKEAEDLFGRMLVAAREFRDKIESLDLADCGMTSDDWLCVVGVDETTRIRLPIWSERGKPVFNQRSVDRANDWNDPDDAKRIRTGDGTVPFAGARCGFIGLEKIVLGAQCLNCPI